MYVPIYTMCSQESHSKYSMFWKHFIFTICLPQNYWSECLYLLKFQNKIESNITLLWVIYKTISETAFITYQPPTPQKFETNKYYRIKNDKYHTWCNIWTLINLFLFYFFFKGKWLTCTCSGKTLWKMLWIYLINREI